MKASTLKNGFKKQRDLIKRGKKGGNTSIP